MSDDPVPLTAWEERLVRGAVEASFDDIHQYGYWDDLRSSSWLTSDRLAVHIREDRFLTRKGVRSLTQKHLLDSVVRDGLEYFRVNPAGEAALLDVVLYRDKANVEALSRLLSDEETVQVKETLRKIANWAEQNSDNVERTQALGLVSAVETLISLPEVPRYGLLALLRDPAFSHAVTLGTFLLTLTKIFL